MAGTERSYEPHDRRVLAIEPSIEMIRQRPSWHYQWIVVHQFLPTVADADVIRDIERNGPRFYRPGGSPFIPAEFSVAAFRFGHPTVRSSYRVNEKFTGKIFPDAPKAPAEPRSDLRGGPVDAEHAIDWRLFFGIGRHDSPQFAKRIDATLNAQLLDLPVSAIPGANDGALARPVASLAVRNMLRSEALGLPSGQDVARKIGEVPLTDEQLGTEGPMYLWYYILKEAEVLAHGKTHTIDLSVHEGRSGSPAAVPREGTAAILSCVGGHRLARKLSGAGRARELHPGRRGTAHQPARVQQADPRARGVVRRSLGGSLDVSRRPYPGRGEGARERDPDAGRARCGPGGDPRTAPDSAGRRARRGHAHAGHHVLPGLVGALR
ncbi:hypothetical protein Atai01_70930 [Amycolatopsis taiwanensis]|uniref:Uncharacterized protein n=1 Tax=Amycolatopsis taiwanensis TaxID=342230 RepID=A0A9W6R6T2_9PSEU|nr:hypothetical protein Atai01_70930 [Amycolatopsis taiwanensis]